MVHVHNIIHIHNLCGQLASLPATNGECICAYFELLLWCGHILSIVTSPHMREQRHTRFARQVVAMVQ